MMILFQLMLFKVLQLLRQVVVFLLMLTMNLLVNHLLLNLLLNLLLKIMILCKLVMLCLCLRALNVWLRNVVRVLKMLRVFKVMNQNLRLVLKLMLKKWHLVKTVNKIFLINNCNNIIPTVLELEGQIVYPKLKLNVELVML